MAQQLAISRELTQKISVEGESDSENDSADENQVVGEDSSNPWISMQPPAAEYSDFVSGYKKFWEDQNKTAKNEEDIINEPEELVDTSKKPTLEIGNDASLPTDNGEKMKKFTKEQVKKSKHLKTITKKKKRTETAISTSDWNVSTSCADSVENIFEKLNSNLSEKCSKKINLLKESLSNTKKSKKIKTSQEKKNEDELSKLSFKNKKNTPHIDEELYESSNRADSKKDNAIDFSTASIHNLVNGKSETSIGEIDPNKFVAPKVKHLQSTIPDIEMGDDHFDDDNDVNNKQMAIAEAFEDDDIVTNFQQDKQSEIDKDNPQINDAFLPGWGSWTGKNLAAPKRKRKCFTDTFKKVPRKDHKKDNLIIKEDLNEKLKSHLVSELPFPFTSVKDFESTVRAPIGNTFIPETAHKKLTKPAVLVKTGVVIKPMDESHLINKNKNDKFGSKIRNKDSKKK